MCCNRLSLMFGLLLSHAFYAAYGEEDVALSVEGYTISSPERPATRSYNEFQKLHPNIHLKPFTSLRLDTSGASGTDSTKLLCFAGGIGPDVVIVPSGNLFHYCRNGFLLDISEFVSSDANLETNEAVSTNLVIPPEYRQAIMVDGKPYAVPIGEVCRGLLYRKDLLDGIFKRSRITTPPRTWDELYYLCQKATEPEARISGARYQRGRRGIHISTIGGFWDALVYSAGGQLLEGGRASFASEAGQAATTFFWKLLWSPWILDPQVDPMTQDHEPINLTIDEVRHGAVILANGREVRFSPQDVRWGVARATGVADDVGELETFSSGEVVFIVQSPSYMFRHAFNQAGIGAQQLGFCPIPASSNSSGRPVFLSESQLWGLNAELSRNLSKRRAAIEVLSWLQQRMPINEVRQLVEEGHASITSPNALIQAGYEDYVEEVPPHLAAAHAQVAEYKVAIPFDTSWQTIRQELVGGVLAQLITSRDYDYRRGLEEAERQANRAVIVQADGASKQSTFVVQAIGYSLIAFVFFLIFLAIRAIRTSYLSPEAGTGFSGGVTGKFIVWLLLLPALGLIAVWSYYPMLKGTLMSFQDYSVAGRSRWIGLENFLGVLLDPRFYQYLLITFKFSFWSLLLGFLSPIILALLLDEIPHFKFTFRMIYLLPNICAGLVIVFLWKMMFYPTESGFLNDLLLRLGFIDQRLLYYQDPDMALLCCIVPGVWASAGLASLIYLAALKNVSPELYDASEVDGANVLRRLWHITLPTIRPLIVINFVGAFIGTFHTMGNIFVMTGGGPDGQTTVLALKIWKDAFVYLNFGQATATAWLLGSGLIGFTVWQLRFLNKVEFRRAENN